MEATPIKNRNDSYFSTQKKQFENCLLPIWIYGSSTQQEISNTLKVPINEITGRFNSCLKNGLIHINPTTPSKKNPRTHKPNTLYILTEQGKDVVRTTMKFQHSQNEVA